MLTNERNTVMRDGDIVVAPVAADKKIFAGALTAISATGYATPGATATDLRVAGRAEETVDNTGGSAGDKTITIRRGVFMYKNDSVDPVAAANRFSDCYIVDDETVAATNGTNTRSKAGKVIEVSSDGVWVDTRY
jgi:hypothetical protein